MKVGLLIVFALASCTSAPKAQSDETMLIKQAKVIDDLAERTISADIAEMEFDSVTATPPTEDVIKPPVSKLR